MSAHQLQDHARIWQVEQLDQLQMLHATIVKYAFKRHTHDYYVIGLVERGLQRFNLERQTFYTPPTGLIVIYPGELHTGEAATENGFRYRALYPSAEIMTEIAAEVLDRPAGLPQFGASVLNDSTVFDHFWRLHQLSESPNTAPLELESRYRWSLAQLILRHAERTPSIQRVHRESVESQRVKAYLEENYAEPIRLAELAALVNRSKFHLLRLFKDEVGVPPHVYLENVRIREAQRLLHQRIPIIDVAYRTGFSSQSHLTTSFKRVIGVTPKQYAEMAIF
jgi:AraC-like DNA-binding protein